MHIWKRKKTRRDFIYIATGGVAAVGAGIVAWSILGSMSPAADKGLSAGLVVDLSKIEEGQQLTIKFEGKPVFIRHRTADEISTARNVDVSELPDPETDNERLVPNFEGKIDPRYLVVNGDCSHFGNIPIGGLGDFGGWYCISNGTHFDTSGRIRKGPSEINMTIPYYKYISKTAIQFLPQELKLLDEVQNL